MDINLNGTVAERCLSRRGFLRGVGLGGLTAVGMSLAACGSSSSTETTSSSASTSGEAVTGGTLNVKPTHAVFVGDCATLRILTSEEAVTDVITIYKVRDGAAGTPGGAGASART